MYIWSPNTLEHHMCEVFVVFNADGLFGRFRGITLMFPLLWVRDFPKIKAPLGAKLLRDNICVYMPVWVG